MLIKYGSNPVYNQKSADNQRNLMISECNTRREVQNFADRHRFVSRSVRKKPLLSLETVELIQKDVSFYLGLIVRAFCSEELNGDDVENVDETNFVIYVENGEKIRFSRDKILKWSDFVSDGEGMKMAAPTSGGRDAKTQPAFMVFKKDSRSYPIGEIPDNVGVPYRTETKGWMFGKELMKDFIRYLASQLLD